MEVDKRIEVVELKVSELNHQFGNPRKIKKKGIEEIKNSLDRTGDWGVIVIDENNSVIAGNQRVKVMMSENPDTKVLCKRLIGYTKAEKRWINIKANTHSGENDEDLLAEWVADLNLEIGIDPKKEKNEKEIELLEPRRYEKYDYVLIMCRSELDFNNLNEKLGLDKRKELIESRTGRKKIINSRAVWYDEIDVDIKRKQ